MPDKLGPAHEYYRVSVFDQLLIQRVLSCLSGGFLSDLALEGLLRMVTWFEENAVDLIGHVLTLLGIIGAAATVVWQIGRQHRSSLLLQRDNAREDLKLRLHEVLMQRVRKLSDANVKASSYAYMIPFSLENYQQHLAQGFRPAPVRERPLEFQRLHTEATNTLVELIEEFESWSIAFPGLEIFQTALNAANHDAREAFGPLFVALLRALPLDAPEGSPSGTPRPLVQEPLSPEQMGHLKMLVDIYKNAMDDIGSYVQDLTIESQNNLLSGLFERRVPPRKPLDPSCKVITTEPAQAAALVQYFENDTPWGRSKGQTERDVRARLGKP